MLTTTTTTTSRGGGLGFLRTSSSSSTQQQSSGVALAMFTGIVEEMGTVVSLEERDDMVLWDGSAGSGTELVVKAGVIMEGAYLG